jgi:hypothetical protein
MPRESKCPVYGHMVEFFDICDTCGWQNDPVQNDDPNYRGGSNIESLNEAKEN